MYSEVAICCLKDTREEEAIISAEHAPALIKYGRSIREMVARGMSWMFYYDEFWRLNNGNPATPWGELHTELYLRVYKTDTDKSVRMNQSFLKSNRQQQTGMSWGGGAGNN